MNLGSIISVARGAMGKVGWKKTAKSTGWSTITATAIGTLQHIGVPFELSLALGAIFTGALNGLYQYLRKYEHVGVE